MHKDKIGTHPGPALHHAIGMLHVSTCHIMDTCTNHMAPDS